MNSCTRSAIALAALASANLPTLADAQNAAPLLQATTATYQDWTRRCDHLPDLSSLSYTMAAPFSAKKCIAAVEKAMLMV